jgi:hypothetical protein
MTEYYMVTANQAFRNQEVKNVFYYQTTAALDDDQKQEVVDTMRNWWATLDGAIDLVNDYELLSATIRYMTLPDYPGEVWVPTSGTFTGSTATPGIANQIALLISFKANTPKPRRARTYLTGFANTAITDAGFWTSSHITAAGVFGNASLSIAVTGDTLQRVAVQLDPDDGSVALANDLTTVLVRSNPATQRRRRIGIGA